MSRERGHIIISVVVPHQDADKFDAYLSRGSRIDFTQPDLLALVGGNVPNIKNGDFCRFVVTFYFS